MVSLFLLGATCLLAYSNGANDNFKGVASLFGSETTSYGTAIRWATAATMAGSVASIFLAQGLLAAFSGKGLVPAAIASGTPFLLAVATGAALTVLLATLLGFPISTTHSLVGAIIGAGLLSAGIDGVSWSALTSTFLAPLLLSPLVALLLAAGLYALFHRTRIVAGVDKGTCVCVGAVQASPTAQPPGIGLAAMSGTGPMAARSSLRVVMDHESHCSRGYAGSFLGVSWQQVVDSAHFLSAGLVSFSRGLNDTPKIAALLLVLQFVDVPGGLIMVGVTIAVGGLLSARRVALTMSHRITAMNHGQGFSANIATGLLVILASRFGLPVSTTHVSVGSLFGIGLLSDKADLGVIRGIVGSWVLTLPCAMCFAALAYWLTASLG